MPAERPASTKASENRRATKPIMEKRRRARINQCLTELKGLILDALNKDPSRHSKLEKADILEMTVRHLQNVQRQQMAAAISTDHTVLNKFRAGFSECANEVSRYVSRIEGVEQGIRQRLVSYLSNCVSSLNVATPFTPPATPGTPGAASMAFPGMTPPFQGLVSPLHVQIPGAGLATIPTIGFAVASSNGPTVNPSSLVHNSDINNNSNGKIPASIAPPAAFSLLPSRLPNGDLAFLVPSQAVATTQYPAASTSSFTPSRSSLSSWGQDPTTPLSPQSPVLSRGSAPSPASSVGSGISLSGSESGSDAHKASSSSMPQCPSPDKKTMAAAPFLDSPHHRSLGGEHAATPTFHPTSVIQRPTSSSTRIVNSTTDSGERVPPRRVSEPMVQKETADNVWRPW